jgi:hypothetical protein
LQPPQEPQVLPEPQALQLPQQPEQPWQPQEALQVAAALEHPQPPQAFAAQVPQRLVQGAAGQGPV